MPNSLQIGHNYELIAAEYLQRQGLSLIANNFRCRMGEIDLIMRDKEYLVFVEVRYRCKTEYGESIETITSRKQHKLRRTAQFYLLQQNLWDKIDCRFDVIAMDQIQQEINIEWIKNAL